MKGEKDEAPRAFPIRKGTQNKVYDIRKSNQSDDMTTRFMSWYIKQLTYWWKKEM